jgi:hypothetical protein
MTDSFTGIIDRLERQKAAIDRALAALREVDSPAAAPKAESAATPAAPTRKRRKFSAAARRKMALAQKSRWAKIKGETARPAPAAAPAKPQRRISPEGMKRIIAATKKRWRLQKAAAKSASAKKAAPKKAKPPSAKAVKKSTAAPAPMVSQAAS